MNEISIAILCSLAGTLLGILGFTRLTKKDSEESGSSQGEIKAQLNYISKGVDDIRLDVKDQGRKIDGINERLVRVEESTKSAHHRIDGLEEKKEM